MLLNVYCQSCHLAGNNKWTVYYWALIAGWHISIHTESETVMICQNQTSILFIALSGLFDCQNAICIHYKWDNTILLISHATSFSWVSIPSRRFLISSTWAINCLSSLTAGWPSKDAVGLDDGRACSISLYNAAYHSWVHQHQPHLMAPFHNHTDKMAPVDKYFQQYCLAHRDHTTNLIINFY